MVYFKDDTAFPFVKSRKFKNKRVPVNSLELQKGVETLKMHCEFVRLVHIKSQIPKNLICHGPQVFLAIMPLDACHRFDNFFKNLFE